ncbi:MAG: hypothetical protein G01um101430_221 [Parcubacteria group bacterium Gr01-1014_30]|nr:MAG: hypothetical protein G01um101430_221 [Parcubacteria group bacterium Gr01-1014_30]
MFIKIHLNKIFVVTVLLLGIGIVVYATSKDDIVFPVPELGNCKSEQECKVYCDSPANIAKCLAFAERHNLLSAEELARAKKFLELGGSGPGGCSNHLECENYCNDINNISECLTFAERSGFIEPDELKEAKKIQAALARGAQLPGGCRNKQACEAYCTSSNHMEECIAFAESAGFIPPDELEEAKKVLAAIKRGVTPPPCMGAGGKEACEAYCRQSENFEVCISFAKEAGLMSDQELQDAEKMLTALRKGVKPPACQSEEECNVYCSQEEHIQECIVFAEAAGFMTPEEAEMARKTGGKGPGDCQGQQECEQFCQNPANQETCFDFAKEHGLLSDQDMRQMEEGLRMMREGLSNAPPEIASCLEGKLGPEVIEGIRTGSGTVAPHMGDVMRECFEQFMPSPEEFGPRPGEEGSFPPEGFAPPEGIPSGFTGPGGCKSQEECMAYCQQHPEECGQFQPPTMPPPSEFQQFPEEHKEEFQQQFEEQYRQQFEKQYQQQQQQEGPTGFFQRLTAWLAAPFLNLLR